MIRYPGKFVTETITFIPDFLIDDKIVVEVKYETNAISRLLSKKWTNYIESQATKRNVLESSGRPFIWFTNKMCDERFYRECIKEVKLRTLAQ